MGLTDSNAIMKPLLAAAMKVAGKGKSGGGKKKASAKASIKAKVKIG